jgi:hypothetical protein
MVKRAFVPAALVAAAAAVAWLLGGPKAPAPAPATGPPAGTTRYIVGGDARDDKSHVVPWAFNEAKARSASAFFFLGDMELTPQWDSAFQKEIDALKPMPFYPTIGNHEVVRFGTQRGLVTKLESFLDPDQVQENIDKFTKRFLNTAETPVAPAPLKGKVAFSTNVKTLHWISLDNVSQPGFGQDQLAWLETDLKAAAADPAKPWIVVGMHKALYNNGTTTHAMGDPTEGNSDSVRAVVIAESEWALQLFQQYNVSVIIASHEHLYAYLDPAKTTWRIPAYITGGMGAPLKKPALPNTRIQHHILQLDTTSDGVTVTPIWFEGTPSMSSGEDEDDKAPKPPAPTSEPK